MITKTALKYSFVKKNISEKMISDSKKKRPWLFSDYTKKSRPWLFSQVAEKKNNI